MTLYQVTQTTDNGNGDTVGTLSYAIFQANEFDRRLNTHGLHHVRSKVEFQPRATVLPPDLFAQYEGLSFWETPTNSSLANVIVAQQLQIPLAPPLEVGNKANGSSVFSNLR
ncbi:hypothetical protein H6G91_19285 [Nostoc muscorum FACHB-395]|jgi:hypothetical protein|uniref:hypothetical protein n=1 Tax=Nostoc sp. C057 TaxID=2576903 RepID=UPI0015C3C411|nr:hypothetical protein [Nostoc sp. C057]MBD2509412.1 hypothetical protein [Desmonostoc muscorum FACHB-395]QLE51984.1 hypothetical protein FD724_30690 [Nostoc sp. C057]